MKKPRFPTQDDPPPGSLENKMKVADQREIAEPGARATKPFQRRRRREVTRECETSARMNAKT